MSNKTYKGVLVRVLSDGEEPSKANLVRPRKNSGGWVDREGEFVQPTSGGIVKKDGTINLQGRKPGEFITGWAKK